MNTGHGHTQTFDCEVAKQKVMVSTALRQVRQGFPPVQSFVSCSGQAHCGVSTSVNGNVVNNWHVCPVYRSMNR